jgi:hypothetical protein
MPDTVFEEHLQLSLVEGFFLSYGLGSLVILNSEKVKINDILEAEASSHSHDALNSSNRFLSLTAGNCFATTASRMNRREWKQSVARLLRKHYSRQWITFSTTIHLLSNTSHTTTTEVKLG